VLLCDTDALHVTVTSFPTAIPHNTAHCCSWQGQTHLRTLRHYTCSTNIYCGGSTVSITRLWPVDYHSSNPSVFATNYIFPMFWQSNLLRKFKWHWKSCKLLNLLKWKTRFFLKFSAWICEVVFNLQMKCRARPRQTRSLATGPCTAKWKHVSPNHHMKTVLFWDITQHRVAISFYSIPSLSQLLNDKFSYPSTGCHCGGRWNVSSSQWPRPGAHLHQLETFSTCILSCITALWHLWNMLNFEHF